MAVDPDHNTDTKSAAALDAVAGYRRRGRVAFLGRAAAHSDKSVSLRPRPDLAHDAWQAVLCKYTVMPFGLQNGVFVVAAGTYVDGLRALRAIGIGDHPSAIALAPRSEILDALAQRYARPLTDAAQNSLRRTTPLLSAATEFPVWMRISLAATILAFVAFLLTAPLSTLVNLWIVFIPYFLATMLLRMILIFHASRTTHSPPPPRKSTPIVSILVPVCNEAQSLPALIAALSQFDYPTRALDIKILLEEHDAETIAEARWRTAGTHIDCLVVPASEPQTKPKAMNVALPFVRGEIVGIFDAEDAPEPDQISKAVAALEAGGEDIVCAQARLSYYNPDDNLLTRCVAMEYALWFDILLTGMSRTRLPMPLGGTSLYFRTDVLRKIGAWDPHNVTEDADLGLRLARAGKRTVIFDSTTYEEATGSLRAWIKQRSRWIKGYMVTWAVHMRQPRQLARDLGLRHMIAINVLLLDGFLSFLLKPLILLSALLVLLTDATIWTGLTELPIMSAALWMLAGGQVVLLLAAFVAARRRFGWRTALAAPLLWPYWVVGGVAAVKALLQVATKPQFWEKTTHCVSPVAQARRDAVLKDGNTDQGDPR